MKSLGISIRPYQDQDWPSVWTIIKPVFRAGETYAFSPEISEQEAKKVWIEKPEVTFVAVGGYAGILGTYYIKPNQPHPGRTRLQLRLYRWGAGSRSRYRLRDV